MKEHYRRFPWPTRAFVEIRSRATSFEALAERLPREGVILDAGCGHGLLAATLALGAPSRRVTGLDHDGARLALARSAYANVSNLEFVEGSLERLPHGPFIAIAAIDVLHYLSASKQLSFVEAASRSLSSGGVLLVRDVDPTLGSVSRWNRVYESLAVRTGMTKAPSSRPHYRAAEEWKREMERVGFTCEIEPPANRFFADVVIRGTKR